MFFDYIDWGYGVVRVLRVVVFYFVVFDDYVVGLFVGIVGFNWFFIVFDVCIEFVYDVILNYCMICFFGYVEGVLIFGVVGVDFGDIEFIEYLEGCSNMKVFC